MALTLEKCRHAVTVSEAQVAQAKVRGGGHYVVAAEKIVCNRLDFITNEIHQLPHTPQADPTLSVKFHTPEIDTLHTIVAALGALHTSDFPPHILPDIASATPLDSSAVPAIAFTVELGFVSNRLRHIVLFAIEVRRSYLVIIMASLGRNQ